MSTEAFVVVNENEVVFAANNGGFRKVQFGIDDYNDFDEYVAAVIYDCIKGRDEKMSLKLVLPSAYYNYGEQVVTGTKSKKDTKYSIHNFSAPISSIRDKDMESTFYFESSTEYESGSKSFDVPDDIPLLQKYLKRKTFLSWNSSRLTSLLSYLSSYEIDVASVVPDIYMYNAVSSKYDGNNAVVTMSERHTDVCVYSGGHVKRMFSFPFGLADMIRRISNAFSLSYHNSRMLMKMYGFVSVPQQYVNYEIKVPVFEDVTRNVKLTDLSYEVQDVLKKQLLLIYDNLKDWDIESVVINGLPVVDAHVLFQMMTGYDCNLLDDISFGNLEKLFGILETNSYSKTLTPLPVYEPNNEVVKPVTPIRSEEHDGSNRTGGMRSAWLNSLVEKINQSREKINMLIME